MPQSMTTERWVFVLLGLLYALVVAFVLPTIASLSLPIPATDVRFHFYVDALTHGCLSLLLLLVLFASTSGWTASALLFVAVLVLLPMTNSIWAVTGLLACALLLLTPHIRQLHLMLLYIGWLCITCAFLLLQTPPHTLTATIASAMRATDSVVLAQWLLFGGFALLQFACGRIATRTPMHAHLLTVAVWYLWLRSWPVFYSLPFMPHVSLVLVIFYLLCALCAGNMHTRLQQVFAAVITLSLWVQTYPSMLAGLLLLLLYVIWVCLASRLSQVRGFAHIGALLGICITIVMLAHLLVPSLSAYSAGLVITASICYLVASALLGYIKQHEHDYDRTQTQTTSNVPVYGLLALLFVVAIGALLPEVLLSAVNATLLALLTVNQPTKLVLDATHVTISANISVWIAALGAGACVLLGSVRGLWYTPAQLCAALCNQITSKTKRPIATCSATFCAPTKDYGIVYSFALIGCLFAFFVLTQSSLYIAQLPFLFTTQNINDISMLPLLLCAAFAMLCAVYCQEERIVQVCAYIASAICAIWLLLVGGLLLSFVFLLMLAIVFYLPNTDQQPSAPYAVVCAVIALVCTQGIAAVALMLSGWFSYTPVPAPNFNVLLTARIWDIVLLVFMLLVIFNVRIQNYKPA